MADSTIFVISDLHIGIGDKFDIFHGLNKTADLSSFIDYIRKQTTPVELIINGDLVDFLQVKPWDYLTRTTALKKIKSIAENSADVFYALGQLLQDSRHKITILLGNHDVELAYPEVWAVLRDAILAAAPANSSPRLVLVDRRTTYRPSVNGVQLHVEHGNMDDSWNAIDYTSLFDDAETGTLTFAHPPGTQFVYDLINGFKEDLQFVDVLKPEMPAVALLLFALRPWKSLTSLPGGLKAIFLALGNGLLIELRRAIGGAPLGPVPAPEADPSAALGYDLAQSCAAVRTGEALTRAFVDDLEEFLNGNDDQDQAGSPTLGGKLDGVKVGLITAALWSLRRFRAQQQSNSMFNPTDHPDDSFAISARSRLKGDIKVAIFGHTHEVLKTEFDDGLLYVNSGAWASLVRLPVTTKFGELLEWLRKLADNKFEKTSYPTFVRIDPSTGGVTIGLHLWDEREAKELWKKNISR